MIMVSYYSPEPLLSPLMSPGKVPVKGVPSGIGERNIVGNWLMCYVKGGDHLHDFSGKGNHATLTSTGTDRPTWVLGKIGWALYFDGDDDYATLTSSSWDFNGDDFTLVAWYRTDMGISNNSNDSRRLLAAGYVGEMWAWAYGAHSEWNGLGNDCYNFFYNDGTYHDYTSNTISGGITKNTWHFAVVKRKGDTLYFYHEGDQVGSVSFTYDSLNANDNQLGIGARQANNDQWQEFHPGKIWLVQVYHPRALTDNEISQLYTKTKA